MAYRIRSLAVALATVTVGVTACSSPPASIAPTGASPSAVASSAGPIAALTPVPGGPGGPGVPGAGLEPTEAEQTLLDGIRLDLRGACGPFRDKVAAGAVGEVGCVPASGQARFIEVVLFEAQGPMLDAYFERLSQAGVGPQENGGSCADAPAAEGAWIPGPDDGRSPPERAACWIDADSAPVYLTTQPPFVLIMLQGHPGATADAAYRYAWAGNEDQPGAPTIWREIPVDAEK